VAAVEASTKFFEGARLGVRAHVLERKLSPSILNRRLSPLRKLAREMAENGLLDSGIASAIERTKRVNQEG
jgi:hypothetical protein